jgi:putative protease
MKKPELLAPAGDWISLRAAIKAGADAVYFGIKEFNMRQNTPNFEINEIKKVVKLCHENNVKAYLAINTIIYEDETEKVEKILQKAKESGIDAIICWDFSVLKLCNKLGLRIHLSTQASISNYEAAEYYYNKFNVRRIVFARECTLEDIKKIKERIIRNKLNLEIETFIHGAMCVSVSGRCFMSQFLFNKSANRGDCLQPCRRSYIITDPEEGYQLELENNYVMSPKDLCALPFLEKLIEAGIDSFKIEGRNRSPEYVKAAVEAYRELIDSIANIALENERDRRGWGTSKKKDKRIEDVFPGVKNMKHIGELKEKLMIKLKTVYNRGFSPGFFMGRPIDEWADSYGSKATSKKVYIGKVVNYFPKQSAAEIKIEAGKLRIGDKIMIQGPTTGIIEFQNESMHVEREPVLEGKNGMRISVKVMDKVRRNDKLYHIVYS